jgi:hypothetical protein
MGKKPLTHKKPLLIRKNCERGKARKIKSITTSLVKIKESFRYLFLKVPVLMV